jgi:hypothetical protein
MRLPNRQNDRRAQAIRSRKCATCGKPFQRSLVGRRKAFCSGTCRSEAHRTAVQRLKNGVRCPTSGLLSPARFILELPVSARNDAKSPCGTGTFFRENRGRPPNISAPRRVIDVEIGGGHVWTETYSINGVRSLVRQLRPKALVNGGAS